MKIKCLAVTCGFDNKDNKIGDILISNTAYKKKFMLLRENANKNQQKVSDLIFNPNEKMAHHQMMLENRSFSENSSSNN